MENEEVPEHLAANLSSSPMCILAQFSGFSNGVIISVLDGFLECCIISTQAVPWETQLFVLFLPEPEPGCHHSPQRRTSPHWAPFIF